MTAIGATLIAGAVPFFLFVTGGIIGGAIAGGVIGCGVMLIAMAITSKSLPHELVHIDSHYLYLNKRIIDLTEIQSAVSKGSTLVVVTQGKKARQVLVKNSAECARHIMELKDK